MDLALNNLQRLICHKTQQTNQKVNLRNLNASYLPYLAQDTDILLFIYFYFNMEK